jgi:hypothetical protein
MLCKRRIRGCLAKIQYRYQSEARIAWIHLLNQPQMVIVFMHHAPQMFRLRFLFMIATKVVIAAKQICAHDLVKALPKLS